jgi:hypothetical protein
VEKLLDRIQRAGNEAALLKDPEEHVPGRMKELTQKRFKFHLEIG